MNCVNERTNAKIQRIYAVLKSVSVSDNTVPSGVSLYFRAAWFLLE